MSKCRYDLSEDCHNKDCVACVLDKIRVEIEDVTFDWQEIDGEHESFMVIDLNDVLEIIDKYKVESEEEKESLSKQIEKNCVNCKRNCQIFPSDGVCNKPEYYEPKENE